MQVIGLHIDGSFAEACLSSTDGSLAATRAIFYLPRQNLKTALPEWLRQNGAAPAAAYVSTRFLERLFHVRLGGSTAQVVTAGLERWPFLNGPALQTGWLKGKRAPAIASPELTFGVDERMGADGEAITPLRAEALTPIVDKLKLMNVRRVCIHFLHAAKSPAHENLAAEVFTAAGFEVFRPPTRADLDESSRWRTSTLEASLRGSFEDHHNEIVAALVDFVPVEKILYADGEGFQPLTNLRRLGTTRGDLTMDTRELKAGQLHLELGWQQWRWRMGDLADQAGVDRVAGKNTGLWNSPWGDVWAPGANGGDLSVQPTQALGLDALHRVGIESTPEGFEPGPMCFGRGRTLLVADLFATDLAAHEVLRDHLPAAGQDRTAAAFIALSRGAKLHDVAELRRSLIQQLVEMIAAETEIRQPREVLISGPFAAFLKLPLEKRLRRTLVLREGGASSRNARFGARETLT